MSEAHTIVHELLTDALDCIDSRRPISGVIDDFLAPKGAPRE